jgi:hypothetical protein
LSFHQQTLSNRWLATHIRRKVKNLYIRVDICHGPVRSNVLREWAATRRIIIIFQSFRDRTRARPGSIRCDIHAHQRPAFRRTVGDLAESVQENHVAPTQEVLPKGFQNAKGQSPHIACSREGLPEQCQEIAKIFDVVIGLFVKFALPPSTTHRDNLEKDKL